MSKDYIRDDGRMRLCESNIAKMNIFEFVYYSRKYILQNIKFAIDQFIEGGTLVVYSIVNMGIVLLYPITGLIIAVIRIRKAKKAVRAMEKWQRQ